MRRLLLLSGGVIGIVVLCAVAVLLAGSRPPEAQSDTAPGESTRATAEEPTKMDRDHQIHLDARAYAEDLGVSLQEANRRLDLQGGALLNRLEGELKTNEPGTFAGLWLRHKPDYGITIATSGSPAVMMEKVRPYVEGTPWEGTVNIERVEATEAELKAARAETERMLGHSTIAQTLDTYSHVMPSMSDATAVAMNEALA